MEPSEPDDAQSEPRPGRHRSSEPRPLEPPRLRDELAVGGWRTPILIFLAGIGLIGWGVQAAFDSRNASTHQWLGFAAVCGGLTLMASYWLYLKPGVLGETDWQHNPHRRRLAFIVRHLWLFALVISAIALVVERLQGG
jgi:hypothetical protein